MKKAEVGIKKQEAGVQLAGANFRASPDTGFLLMNNE